MRNKDAIHREILEDALKDPPLEDPIQKAIKTIIISLIGFAMIFLTVSYLIPSPSFVAILFAQWDSFEIKNNTISLPDHQKIFFQNETYDMLRTIYFRNQQHEFKACLLGYQTGTDYIVTNIALPEIISQDLRSVTAKPCPRSTIIDLHSHPVKRCHFSLHDLHVYDRIRNQNPSNLIAVMCEHNRFNVYGFN
jgi:proteasome lid subunit RPN8/RPN11